MSGSLTAAQIPQHISDEAGGVFDAILHDGTMTSTEAWAMLMSDIGPMDELDPSVLEAVRYTQVARADYDDQWFTEDAEGDIAGWKVDW